MKTTDILIITFFIIESIIISYFIYIYLKNEKLNKLQREAEFKKLQSVILDKIVSVQSLQENKLNYITKKTLESFEDISKNIKLYKEQNELGIELIIKENLNNVNYLKNEINQLKNNIADYSFKNETQYLKLVETNKKNNMEVNKFKEEMQNDLKEIINEIKAPLDLD